MVDCAVSFLSFTLLPHDLSQLAFFIFIIEHHNIWHQIHLSLKPSLSSSLFSVKQQKWFVWRTCVTQTQTQCVTSGLNYRPTLMFTLASLITRYLRHLVCKNLIVTLFLWRWLALSRCCWQIWKGKNLQSCSPLVKAFRLFCIAQHTLLLLLCLKFIALYIVSFKMVKPHSLEKLMTCTLKQNLN